MLLQTTSFINAQKTQFGFKVGANFSNLDSSDGNASRSLITKISFHAGVFLVIPLSNKFAIQPELFYSSQGSSFNYTIYKNYSFTTSTNKFLLSYINIPVLLKYDLEKNTYLEFGPQLAILTNADLEINAGNKVVTKDVSDLFYKTDFGLNFGFGINLNEILAINGRYSLGLTNIVKPENANDKSTLTNTVISAGLVLKLEN